MAISPTEIRAASPGPGAAPGGLAHTGWIRIFRVPPENEDGVEAHVYVQRMPARFYRVVAPAIGLDLTTGSSQEELVAEIVNALTGGMLGVTG